MSEHTKIKTVRLPAGQRWAWYADANVLGLSPDLVSQADRDAAISEAVTFWRHNLLDMAVDRHVIAAVPDLPA